MWEAKPVKHNPAPEPSFHQLPLRRFRPNASHAINSAAMLLEREIEEIDKLSTSDEARC